MRDETKPLGKEKKDLKQSINDLFKQSNIRMKRKDVVMMTKKNLKGPMRASL